MTQQEIFQNMTKGELILGKDCTAQISREKDGMLLNIFRHSHNLGGNDKEMLKWREQEANIEAAVTAVNNTYGKGINPESVERFKKFAETFFNYYSSMEYQLNWDKLAEEHTGGNVDFIAWATGEAQDILFNSRLEAPKIKNHE